MREIKGDKMVKKQRNSNIEVLRIIATFMVILLHALGWSRALQIMEYPHIPVYWGLEAISIVAVNVFVLISGYYMVESKFKANNIFKIGIGGVWIYSIIFGMISLKLSGEAILPAQVIKIIFPLITKKFWFINSYLTLYILSPILNKTINSISKKMHTYLIIVMFILFSVRTTIFPMTWSQDPSGGMGIITFIMIYIMASWIRKYYQIKNHVKIWGGIYILCVLTLVLSKVIMIEIGALNYSTKFYMYNSPVVIIESISLFLLFLNRKPINGRSSNIINKMAQHSFSCYIIHFSMLSVLFTKIIPLDKYVHRVSVGVILALVSCIVIFLFCIMVDMLKTNLEKRYIALIESHKSYKAYMKICKKWDEIANEGN